jgi:transposase
MSENQRNRYTKEFKLQIVRLLRDEQRTVLEVSRDTGINRAMIYRWLKLYNENPEIYLPGQNSNPSEKEELRRLKKKLSDVYEENQILKKALAIFSKQPKINS